MSETTAKKPRKKLHDLDPESPEYWERVLQYHGLGMGQGSSSKVRLSGGAVDLEKTERKIAADLMCGGGRRVKPKGSKPTA